MQNELYTEGKRYKINDLAPLCRVSVTLKPSLLGHDWSVSVWMWTLDIIAPDTPYTSNNVTFGNVIFHHPDILSYEVNINKRMTLRSHEANNT